MAPQKNGLAINVLQIILVSTCAILATAAKYRRPPFCETLEMVSTDKQPKSFLWSISERVPPAYFFGTIHVPYTRVWDFVPENVKEAFVMSDNVFFELDLMDPYTIAALANCQMLPSGEILADVLPGDVYERLERHLDYVRDAMPSWLSEDQRGRGLYADYLFNAITGNWQRKRPVWIMLMVNSLTENDIKSRGIPVLDLYLAQEAQRMDKKSGAVERVEEQCLPLNGLNFTQVLIALNQTLLQQESLRSGGPYPGISTDDLIKYYNCGDLNAVYIDGNKEQEGSSTNITIWPQQDMVLSKNIDQYFKDELVHKRNVRMGERVLQLLNTYPDESFFFAFGAGHFLGENTVLDYVKSQGFKVEQVPVSKKLYSGRKAQHHHHHSRHRHKADKFPFNKIGPWTGHDSILRPSSISRPSGRRRYRKQRPNHPHHHPGVQLLRTSTSASAKSKTQRTFNDLWVKLDADTSTTSKNFQPSVSTKEFEEFEQSLTRMWYGDSNSAQNLRKSSQILWIICVFVLWWTSVLKIR